MDLRTSSGFFFASANTFELLTAMNPTLLRDLAKTLIRKLNLFFAFNAFGRHRICNRVTRHQNTSFPALDK